MAWLESRRAWDERLDELERRHRAGCQQAARRLRAPISVGEQART